jgi:hypothetical protein
MSVARKHGEVQQDLRIHRNTHAGHRIEPLTPIWSISIIWREDRTRSFRAIQQAGA